MAMFKKLVNAVAEVVAPTEQSQYDNFKKAWKGINTVWESTKDDDDVPVAHTSIPARLTQMHDILVEEDDRADGEFEPGSMPCMDHLIEHRVLDAIYERGKRDSPPGMIDEALSFFTALLRDTTHPLIPHVAFHQPLVKLLDYCFETDSSLTSAAHVQLLCQIVAVLDADPSLTIYFEQDVSDGSGVIKKSFIFVPGLVVSMCAATESGALAREAVVKCVGIPDENVVNYIAERTALSSSVAAHVSTRFAALHDEFPNFDEPEESAAESEPEYDVVGEESNGDPYPELTEFREAVAFANELVCVSPPAIGDHIVAALSANFLNAVVQPALLSPAEHASHAATLYTTVLLEELSAPLLCDAVVAFLVGVDPLYTSTGGTGALAGINGVSSEYGEPETRGKPCASHTLRDTLIQRLDSLSSDMCVASTELFLTLLSLYHEGALHSLVLRNLLPHAAVVERAVSDHASVHAAVERCLSLVPVTTTSTVESGYDLYLIDAHKESDSVAVATGRWGENSTLAFRSRDGKDEDDDESAAMPVRASLFDESTPGSDGEEAGGSAEAESSVSKALASGPPFYEGLFLETIFNRLETFLDAPLDANVVLTGVVTQLMHYPHELLHSYLLDPSPPIEGARTLYTVLDDVSQRAAKRAQSVKDFPQRLSSARRALAVCGAGMDPGVTSNLDKMATIEGGDFLQAVVVLEEFCKELAAVLQATAALA